jgi:hypothetical protein
MQIDIEITESFLVIMVLEKKNGLMIKHEYEIFISLYLGIC